VLRYGEPNDYEAALELVGSRWGIAAGIKTSALFVADVEAGRWVGDPLRLEFAGVQPRLRCVAVRTSPEGGALVAVGGRSLDPQAPDLSARAAARGWVQLLRLDPQGGLKPLRLIRLEEDTEGPYALAFDPVRGEVLAGLFEGVLLRLDPNSGEVVGRLTVSPKANPVRALAVAPGARWLATGSGLRPNPHGERKDSFQRAGRYEYRGRVWRWTDEAGWVEEGEAPLQGLGLMNTSVEALAFAPSGPEADSAGLTLGLRASNLLLDGWDAGGSRSPRRVRLEPVRPDDQAGDFGFEVSQRLSQGVTSLSYGPGGRFLFVTHGNLEHTRVAPGAVVVLSQDRGEVVLRQVVSEATPWRVRVTPDGAHALVLLQRGFLRIHRLEWGE
jgi:hypothetical protein